jgi:hypothetical protein
MLDINMRDMNIRTSPFDEIETSTSIKTYKKLIKRINTLIDILLKECDANIYYLYDYNNKVQYEFSYETSIFGDCPRYEILAKNRIDYNTSIIEFRYYYGYTYLTLSYTKTKLIKDFTLIGDLLYTIELIERENISRKINKYCNKIIKLNQWSW